MGDPARVVVHTDVGAADGDSTQHCRQLTVMRWLELAEHHLFRAAKIDRGCWTHHCDITFPTELLCGEQVDFELWVSQVRGWSLALSFVAYRGVSTVVTGHASVTHVDQENGLPLPWPADTRRLLLDSGLVADVNLTRPASIGAVEPAVLG